MYQGVPSTYNPSYPISTPIGITRFTPISNIHLPEFPKYSTQEIPALKETPPWSILKSQWRNKDDLLLCSTWLNIGKDVVVKNDQSGNNFWRWIIEFYH